MMSTLDPLICVTGFVVGTVVGMTGMGGGALMTPLLVLFFGVEPLAAVSSDLLASMLMKPFGGFVHWRRGTVHRRLVLFLMLGSIPSAFAGVLLLRTFASGDGLQIVVRTGLGVALLVVSACLIVRPLMARRRPGESSEFPLGVHPLRTVAIGVMGGLIVGMTSVGSGSLMIMLLLLAYPRIRLSDLVGTDLVQAIPLVSAAALAHLLFGELHLSLTASILIGSIPGVLLGAHFSSRAPDYWIRPALVVVLLLSALKLLGGSNVALAVAAPLLVGCGVTYGLVAARRARGSESEPDVAPAVPSVEGGNA